MKPLERWGKILLHCGRSWQKYEGGLKKANEKGKHGYKKKGRTNDRLKTGGETEEALHGDGTYRSALQACYQCASDDKVAEREVDVPVLDDEDNDEFKKSDVK